MIVERDGRIRWENTTQNRLLLPWEEKARDDGTFCQLNGQGFGNRPLSKPGSWGEVPQQLLSMTDTFTADDMELIMTQSPQPTLPKATLQDHLQGLQPVPGRLSPANADDVQLARARPPESLLDLAEAAELATTLPAEPASHSGPVNHIVRLDTNRQRRILMIRIRRHTRTAEVALTKKTMKRVQSYGDTKALDQQYKSGKGLVLVMVPMFDSVAGCTQCNGRVGLGQAGPCRARMGWVGRCSAGSGCASGLGRLVFNAVPFVSSKPSQGGCV